MADEPPEEDRVSAEVYRPPPGTPFWYEENERTFSLIEYLNVLLRHRWKVLGVPLVLAGLIAAWTVLQSSTYTADTTLMPQSGGAAGQFSQISGVAAQFGIEVPSGQAGQSPQFYSNLLTSRRLLEDAVTTRYRTLPEREAGGNSQTTAQGEHPAESEEAAVSDAGTDDRTLVDLYEVQAPSQPEAVAKAARRLRHAVSVSTNTETGVVTLEVTTPWPRVSKQVADRLIELVNRFNNRVRQTQASAEAEFVADRLQEARGELRAAEDSLENFLQRNVSWQQSPELRFEHDRLQRRVSLKQQVFTSLASRFEEARISEVKNTPVVTTVTPPEIPVRADPGRLPMKVVLGLVLGGMIGVFWAFGSEYAEQARTEDIDDYREFLSLRDDAVEDVRRAGHHIRRVLGSGPRGDDS